MPISTVDGIVAALAQKRQPLLINKQSLNNTLSGQYTSLWRALGTPGQGAIPTVPEIPTTATVGAFPFTPPVGGDHSYLALATCFLNAATNDVQVHDRLAHMGGLNSTVTTAQTVGIDITGTANNIAERRGAADYSDVLWWLEVYQDLGGTGTNATVNVTYDDGSTDNLTTFPLSATVRASRIYSLAPRIAGRYIRAINTVTLSASTGTAGNFGFTATRLLASVPTTITNVSSVMDWAALGLPRVHNDACLQLVQVPSSTSTGQLFGRLVLIQG